MLIFIYNKIKWLIFGHGAKQYIDKLKMLCKLQKTQINENDLLYYKERANYFKDIHSPKTKL